MDYPQPINDLISYFSKFPGIGSKTAERFVLYLLEKSPQDLEKLCRVIKNLEKIGRCKLCGNFILKTGSGSCSICQDIKRNKKIICLVAKVEDIFALEKTNQFQGVYHILGNLINMAKDVGPEKLKIKELLNRIRGVEEIIFAFSPTLEGETTILYLKKVLAPYKIRLTRLARGLPIGGEIEYADEITLSDALQRRFLV